MSSDKAVIAKTISLTQRQNTTLNSGESSAGSESDRNREEALRVELMRNEQVTIAPDRTWKKTKRNIIVLLIVCAITVGLLQFFGSPPSLEDLIVGVLAIGVFVAFQLGDYLERRLQSLENRLQTADGVASVVAAETSIVETLNGLRQQLMHIEKEVDFIART